MLDMFTVNGMILLSMMTSTESAQGVFAESFSIGEYLENQNQSKS